MFASKTYLEHLARGVIGVAAIALAVYFGRIGGGIAVVASLALGIAALAALRGCPICWAVGLVEIVAARKDNPA